MEEQHRSSENSQCSVSQYSLAQRPFLRTKKRLMCDLLGTLSWTIRTFVVEAKVFYRGS